MPDLLGDLTTATLTKSLDVAGLRQRTIADNIANVETPGFKRSDVSFEGQLRQALDIQDDRMAASTVDSLSPDRVIDKESPAGTNGNNVSMDKEMAALTKNTLKYETLVQLMEAKYNMIRTAVTEGRR